jgi:nucleoid DNA-binding protein
MQRKEFVSKIAEKTDMKLKDVNAVLDGFIEVMAEAFEDDERVELRGFGNFIAKTRKARKARNIQTGEVVDVPAKKILTFKQSSLFNTK